MENLRSRSSSEERPRSQLSQSSQPSQPSKLEVDYSGAGYSLSDEEEANSPLVAHPPRSFTDADPSTPASAASRSTKRSLLRRLASVKRPRPTASATINPRNDRYSVLDWEDGPADDMPPVDISFFEGFQFQSDSKEPKSTKHVRTTSTKSADSAAGRKLSVDVDTATRSASIRKQGQDLANETNAVVAVDRRTATVDLSVLEGMTSPDVDPGDRNYSMPQFTKTRSFFYPEDPEKPNWKPIPMRSAYIIMLAVVSLTLAGVQEYLFQRSRQLESQGRGLIDYDEIDDLPGSLYFAWKYLPTMVTVCYGVLWQVADYEVQRLEPYYQLSQPTGNTAEKSLNLDYVTMWSYFVPYKAIKYRHWTVLVSVLGTILAGTAVPSLQAASMHPVGNPKCRGLSPESDTKCDWPKSFLTVHPVWSRLVTSCLGLIAILAIILLVKLRRKSGLLSDPQGVAGVAAMANRSHILAEFQGMDESVHDDVHKKLQHRRYVLYKSTIWQGECTDDNDDNNNNNDKKDNDEAADGKSEKTGSQTKSPNPQPIILRSTWLISFIVFMFVCLPFVPAISFDDTLNRGVHRNQWFPVLVSALIKQLWATLQFNVKMLEPFHTLSKGNARPEQTLTLDYQGTPYGAILFKALFNKHWLVALVSAGAVLGDLLTITMSSLAVKTETRKSHNTSSILSTAIIAFMICSACLVLVRRRKPFMPRQPSTIASVLAFICQSQMLDDFTDTQYFTNKQMQQMLMDTGKRYGLGWFRGRDGRPHCAIDQEPMLSRYVHGVSYIRATAPWEEIV